MNKVAKPLAIGAFLCLIAAMFVFYGGLKAGGLHHSVDFVKWTRALLIVSAIAGLLSIRKSAAGTLGGASAAVSLYLIYFLSYALELEM